MARPPPDVLSLSPAAPKVSRPWDQTGSANLYRDGILYLVSASAVLLPLRLRLHLIKFSHIFPFKYRT